MGDNAQTLDAADRAILVRLAQDARVSADALAEEVGLSASSVRRRLQRLRTSGAIQREVAVIDPALRGIEIVVAVSMRDEDRVAYDRLKRRLRRADEVSQCYAVTGEVDLILHVHMASMESYESWIDENILSEAAVRRCTSYVIYGRVKFAGAAPLS